MCLEASDVFRPVLWEVATLGDSKKALPFPLTRRSGKTEGKGNDNNLVWILNP